METSTNFAKLRAPLRVFLEPMQLLRVLLDLVSSRFKSGTSESKR